VVSAVLCNKGGRCGTLGCQRYQCIRAAVIARSPTGARPRTASLGKAAPVLPAGASREAASEAARGDLSAFPPDTAPAGRTRASPPAPLRWGCRDPSPRHAVRGRIVARSWRGTSAASCNPPCCRAVSRRPAAGHPECHQCDHHLRAVRPLVPAHMGDFASTAFSSWCHHTFSGCPVALQIRGLNLLHDPRSLPCACPTHIRSPCITTEPQSRLRRARLRWARPICSAAVQAMSRTRSPTWICRD
jgi:hypothetical protein